MRPMLRLGILLLCVVPTLARGGSAPATMDELRQALAEIPPGFTVKEDDPAALRTCDALRVRARSAYQGAVALLKTTTDPTQKAELEEMRTELGRRVRPILYHYLRAATKSIPRDLRGLKKAELDTLRATVAGGIMEGDFFIRTFPDVKEAAQVRYFLARMLFLNSGVAQRAWEDLYKKQQGERASVELRLAWRKAYFDRLLSLVSATLKDETIPGWMQERTFKLKADVLATSGKRGEAADLYVLHMKKWPDAPEVKSALAYVNAGQSYLYAEMGEKAEKILREGMERGKDSTYFPHIVDFFYKSLTASGKLEDAEALWLKYMPIFAARGKEAARPKLERNSYASYSEWALFRLGYVNFGLLRFEQAKDFFRQHLEYIADLTAAGKTISPPLQVHGQRSKYLLDRLQEHVMTPAPELALEKLWARNRSYSIAENQGKVSALMLRSYDGSRSQAALKFLQKEYEKYGEDAGPLAVVTVSYLKGREDPQEQLKAVEEEMQELGLTFHGGLDPTPRKELFKKYGVNIGSATLVFIDPLGRIAHYEQDPRPNAFGLFRSVIEALLKGE